LHGRRLLDDLGFDLPGADVVGRAAAGALTSSTEITPRGTLIFDSGEKP